jgi:hypothetical protein
MASVVIANAQERAEPSVPRRADGGLYRYEMIFAGFAARVYADSVTELCEHLIAGYAELDNDVAQAAARIQHAVRVQVQFQADIVAQHGMEGCTATERKLLLGSRHEPPVVGEWQPDVPLVLVDVYYEPLGPLPQPKGKPRSGGPEGSNLIWLRPGDEADLVESLAQVGLIVVSIAGDGGEPV